MARKPKWSQAAVKDAIRCLRAALECIKEERPLSFGEALTETERYIQQAREEHEQYREACEVAAKTLGPSAFNASPEALYYRRHGKFPPKKAEPEED